MTTARVYLIKRPRTLPSGKRAHYWVIRWHGIDGKQFSESLGRCDRMTKREAEEFRRTKEMAIGAGRELRDKPKRMTLAEFIAQDRQSIAGDVRGSTLIEYDMSMDKAKAALGESIEIARITAAEAGKVKQHVVDMKRSPATVRKTLRTLRSAFARAATLGMVNRNPFLDVKLPKVDAGPVRVFTAVEMGAIIAASADNLWWQSFIAMAVTSGLRRDELLNLTWRDIDMDKGTVTVQAKRSTEHKVKGGTLRTWDWDAKAKASYRAVPLPDDTIATLRKQRMKQGASPFVFITMGRLRQMQRHINTTGRLPAKFELVNNLLRGFVAIQVKALAAMQAVAKDPSKVEFPHGCIHDLRRTYCTRLAEAGVPIHALKQYAGHSDIATTASFYLNVSDGMADRVRLAVTTLAAG